MPWSLPARVLGPPVAAQRRLTSLPYIFRPSQVHAETGTASMTARPECVFESHRTGLPGQSHAEEKNLVGNSVSSQCQCTQLPVHPVKFSCGYREVRTHTHGSDTHSSVGTAHRGRTPRLRAVSCVLDCSRSLVCCATLSSLDALERQRRALLPPPSRRFPKRLLPEGTLSPRRAHATHRLGSPRSP